MVPQPSFFLCNLPAQFKIIDYGISKLSPKLAEAAGGREARVRAAHGRHQSLPACLGSSATVACRPGRKTCLASAVAWLLPWQHALTLRCCHPPQVKETLARMRQMFGHGQRLIFEGKSKVRCRQHVTERASLELNTQPAAGVAVLAGCAPPPPSWKFQVPLPAAEVQPGDGDKRPRIRALRLAAAAGTA